MHYIVPGLFWGAYAAAKQLRISGAENIVGTAVLNIIAWPIGMLAATIAEFTNTQTLADAINKYSKRSK